jgi:hypothetical protein
MPIDDVDRQIEEARNRFAELDHQLARLQRLRSLREQRDQSRLRTD